VTLLVIALVFGGLVFAHELGHFLAAKRVGVQVDEFALGFGPRLAAVRRGETVYAVRLFPLGGFVRMAGMAPPPPDDDGPEARSARQALRAGRGFANQTLAARAGIIAAGPAMSFLLAVLLFAVVFAAVGVPSQPTLTVAAVEAGDPAAAAGLQPGDRIEAIDGRPLQGWNDLKQTVAANPGRRLVLTVRRQGRVLTVPVVPAATPNGGLIGVAPVMAVQRLPVATAIGQGLATTWGVVAGWFAVLAMLLHGRGAGDLMGPVGIGQAIGQASTQGLASVLFVAGLLSANLGLINLLPVPALDGSRLAFIGLEWLRGRPVDPEKENFIHFVGFALLILLSVVITYRDVLRLTMG
jgi:regulator of sigma E protease